MAKCGAGLPARFSLCNHHCGTTLVCRLLGNGKSHEKQVLFVVKFTIDGIGQFEVAMFVKRYANPGNKRLHGI